MHEKSYLLKKYWQHDSFREPQEKIIDSVLQGHDTFALMPTGGGKSLCFQIPALMMEGICLVISPLIALMENQVQNLQKRNIKAIALTGGISQNEISDLLDNCRFGNYKFLYLSPERLQQDWIMDRIKGLPVNLIAIDEAHCVSQWGHDFRPAYLKISELKKHFSQLPFLALTASATQRVQDDIIINLKLNNPKVFRKSFRRENIAYMVINTEDKLYKIQQILAKNPQPSIIYVRNRKACHDVSAQLNALGFKASFYHGGLSVKEKEQHMKLWIDESVQVIVATNAFGMGIDKPNVKTVIHIQLPENLESYYQEAGRAGRNGEKSYAVLLLSPSDAEAGKNQFISVLPDKNFVKKIYIKLNNYLQIAYGEGIDQEFTFNINDFCRQYNFPVINTYNALQFLDRQGVITLSKEFSEKIKVRFLLSSKEILRYISLNPNDEDLVTEIARNYPGIYEMELPVNTDFLSRKLKTTESEIIESLKKLAHKEILSFQNFTNDSRLVINEVREDDRTINRISKYLENQNEIKIQQFSAVVNYVNNNSECKSRIILEYFDEKVTEDCGICSYCVSKKQVHPDYVSVAKSVLAILSQKGCDSREIEQMLDLTQQETIIVLQLLLEQNQIKINNNNQYTLL